MGGNEVSGGIWDGLWRVGHWFDDLSDAFKDDDTRVSFSSLQPAIQHASMICSTYGA
jgi:hypothetical protein